MRHIKQINLLIIKCLTNILKQRKKLQAAQPAVNEQVNIAFFRRASFRV